MDIAKIDKNFAQQTKRFENGMVEYTLPYQGFDLYGIFYDESQQRFLRVPTDVAKATSEGVAFLARNTTGGRLRFSTDSTKLEMEVEYDSLCRMSHMPIEGSSGFILLEDTDEGLKHHCSFMPAYTDEKGYKRSTYLGEKKVRDFILFFPLYNDVKSLKISLDEDATVLNRKNYRDVKPILYYGSSITQGGCASRADNSYQGFISKWNNIDYINLGFSGNGKAELPIVDYMADIPCSLFVCDYDYNAPTLEYLKDTHFRLYEHFRAKQPTTPIIFITAPNPETNPIGQDRIDVIYKTYQMAQKSGDKNVYFINGYDLYGKTDRFSCSVDNCHPNDLGFFRMAQVIYKTMCEISEQFK